MNRRLSYGGSNFMVRMVFAGLCHVLEILLLVVVGCSFFGYVQSPWCYIVPVVAVIFGILIWMEFHGSDEIVE